MNDLGSRQIFCEHFASELVKQLNVKFSKEVDSKKCLLQRTKHGSKKTQPGFVMTKCMVSLLKSQYEEENFETIFESCLDSVTRISKSWSVSMQSWKLERGNYIILIDKTKAFNLVIKKVVEFEETPSLFDNECLLFCHLNNKPLLDDIRTLIYSSLLRKVCRDVTVILSFECVDNSYCKILKELRLNLECSTHEGLSNSNTQVSDLVPTHFVECFSDDKKDLYPSLVALRHHKTAIASGIVNHNKNNECNALRMGLSKRSDNPITVLQVCSEKHRVQAQQTELFHAWSRDRTKVTNAQTFDKYLVHSGVQSNACSTAVKFIELRRKEIKDSFEAKLQVNLKGEEWDEIFGKMLAATIKLEFLKTTPTNRLKLLLEDNSLPTDVMFVLYNYSRLNMLIESFSEKVKQGHYPPLPPIEELNFDSLVENAEWELLIDHLWMFQDLIKKPLFVIEDFKINISSHCFVDFLRQLCRSVSAFYSRHHILGENLPHLTPVLHQRIYLMKAAKSAMDAVFNLLDIEPLKQM